MNRFLKTCLEQLFIANLFLTGSTTTLPIQANIKELDYLANMRVTPEIEVPFNSDLNQLKVELMDAVSDKNKVFHNILDKYYISETTWFYKSGEVHLGNDYEAKKGSSIHSPISGYIVMEDHSITRTGYLGSTDGYYLDGSGNSIYMIGEMEGKIYGFIFMHCKEVFVREGDFVIQDEVIGTVGDVGDADSPHVHLEMFYLGDGNISDYINNTYDIDYGVGRDVIAYRNRCDRKNTAPCILDSRDYIGVYTEGGN